MLRDLPRDYLPAAGDAHGARALRFVHDRGQVLSRFRD